MEGRVESSRELRARRGIVVLDGDRPVRADLDAAWPGWSAGADLVVAADGGALLARALGLAIDAWVGDGDSIPAVELDALEQAGVSVHRSPVEKDESDAELALVEAVGLGATDLTILGALGGRVDHALSNVLLLLHPVLAGLAARIVDPAARVTVVSAPDPLGRPVSVALAGRRDDLVTLLPLDEFVEAVTTDGLVYPLRAEPLARGRSRGLSNVRLAEVAQLRVGRGRLLVIEVPATLGR